MFKVYQISKAYEERLFNDRLQIKTRIIFAMAANHPGF